MIVLFKIPYKYDRIEKTKKEKRADRKSRSKRRRKLKGLRQKNRAISNILVIEGQKDLLMTADKARNRLTTNVENRKLLDSTFEKQFSSRFNESHDSLSDGQWTEDESFNPRFSPKTSLQLSSNQKFFSTSGKLATLQVSNGSTGRISNATRKIEPI